MYTDFPDLFRTVDDRRETLAPAAFLGHRGRMAPASPLRRCRDPRRRKRIIAAAVEVIGESGPVGFTHSAAAAKADVPLGSTTYYFVDLDELFDAAVRTVAERNVARLRDWANSLLDKADLRGELAEFLVLLTTTHRQSTVPAYELYGVALRRPALRAASTAWDDMLSEVFALRMDEGHGQGAHSDVRRAAAPGTGVTTCSGKHGLRGPASTAPRRGWSYVDTNSHPGHNRRAMTRVAGNQPLVSRDPRRP
jgi:TetR/AcrR family transcriptional regulator, regulator of biofilm formation and stress response